MFVMTASRAFHSTATRQLDHIDPERHAGHAFALENHLDLISRLAEQAGLRMNGATQAE
jgi:hypothetical protein